jgi:pimeloyl-ACP methyl ester carboxylesterase
MEARTIQLRDKRNLAYAEYGKLDGVPVVYFHGTPGSRVLPSGEIQVAEKLGIRLIVPDRPGYGMSDFQPARQILDWPDDVLELAGTLALDRFGIVSVSGGSPYAAACAYKIPDHLSRVAMVCSIVPFNAFGDPLQLPTEDELEDLAQQDAEQVREKPDEFLQELEAFLPEPDRAVLKRADVTAFFLATVQEAYRQGIQGHIHESLLIQTRPWGFSLEAIATEVQLWHGERDRPERARYLSERIPNSTCHLLADVGHLIPLPYWDKIFSIFVP